GKPGDGADAVGAAEKLCPGARLEEKTFTASGKDGKCRQALRALFQTDAFTSHELDLTFEVPPLQAQLQGFGLPKALTAKYSGAGLVLSGSASAAEHRQALWTVFKKSAG